MKSPAEIASEKALAELFKAIDDSKSFRFEAGAGAGKTYSLIKALEYLIEKKSTELSKNAQKIACITYTNVAKDEILERIDNNPLVYTETIHGFVWNIIQRFQKQLRDFVPLLNEKWAKRIEDAGGIINQIVEYNLGYPTASEEKIALHHNDVIDLVCMLLESEKFRKFLTHEFPIILIDEYQDTKVKFADRIQSELIEKDAGILFGFFGDHWQKIYGRDSCGKLESKKILEINKGANFRSDKNIVIALNKMRPELDQAEKDANSKGDIAIYHTNSFSGARLSGNHWKGDLPDGEAKGNLDILINKLETEGWDFSKKKSKVLMLTNNALAYRQGYKDLVSVFNDSDDYLKKNDHYIKFFTDTLEPLCLAFEEKKYGEMFSILNTRAPHFTKLSDKTEWNQDLIALCELRKTGTVLQVLEHLKETNHPRISHKIEERENEFQLLSSKDDRDEKEERKYQKIRGLHDVKYSQVIELTQFLEEKTPFSTKHGVKGAQFDNVLVICGRGWNQYNWDDFLNWSKNGYPKGKEDSFERNRNLFYVACSRAKHRLTVLFTQELGPDSVATLESWFGKARVKDISTIYR